MQYLLIIPQVIDNVEVNAINARELWENLEVKTPFHMWIQRRVDDSMFVEGQDYLTNKSVREVGGVQVDYIISLEMVKHLAMMEKTGKAFEVRQYFIDAETIRIKCVPCTKDALNQGVINNM